VYDYGFLSLHDCEYGEQADRLEAPPSTSTLPGLDSLQKEDTPTEEEKHHRPSFRVNKQTHPDTIF
jgi:hypothetical protein